MTPSHDTRCEARAYGGPCGCYDRERAAELPAVAIEDLRPGDTVLIYGDVVATVVSVEPSLPGEAGERWSKLSYVVAFDEGSLNGAMVAPSCWTKPVVERAAERGAA